MLEVKLLLYLFTVLGLLAEDSVVVYGDLGIAFVIHDHDFDEQHHGVHDLLLFRFNLTVSL